MDSDSNNALEHTCWFVGAYFTSGDQTDRFVSEGIWENGYKDQLLDEVRSIRPGDLIAIKASYNRKQNLPFENRKGNSVSIMSIKATGEVLENYGDGRRLKVAWTRVDPPREWYFFTYLKTLWRVEAEDWKRRSLIEFTFNGKPQDYNRFRNDPFWRDRYGDEPDSEDGFSWTKPYETLADGLLKYHNNRTELIEALHEISQRVKKYTPLNDKEPDGSIHPLNDICPFTVFGTFNRSITEENRRQNASQLADFLEIQSGAITSFRGLPVLNNQNSWFFSYAEKRQAGDIDKLWAVFACAIAFADTPDSDTQAAFSKAYDAALSVRGIRWNLTTGLFWIRPWFFPTLDSTSREFITKHLKLNIGRNGPRNHCLASDYLKVKDILETRFQEPDFPVHSFPELSAEAHRYITNPVEEDTDEELIDDGDQDPSNGEESTGTGGSTVSYDPYSVKDILNEGCFLSQAEVHDIVERIRSKKNLILQGPPGTGKTWLAKKLAYALMGEKAKPRVRSVQFHPNLSYEDFVRGWRPCGDGKLELVDGPFVELANQANQDADNTYVLVIEEINRGHPAQIFGELLTLIEGDKRTPDAAIELSYGRGDDKPFHVPKNLYIIGTMNIADRSLALVDYALRRRFAFITLEPRINDRWSQWLQNRFNVDPLMCSDIQQRMQQLNQTIAASPSLGKQFQVGHSYVTPGRDEVIESPRAWFRQVVKTEIAPLLEEYWYEEPAAAEKAVEQLLDGIS